MPSLEELETFSQTLTSLGDEAAVLEARRLTEEQAPVQPEVDDELSALLGEEPSVGPGEPSAGGGPGFEAADVPGLEDFGAGLDDLDLGESPFGMDLDAPEAFMDEEDLAAPVHVASGPENLFASEEEEAGGEPAADEAAPSAEGAEGGITFDDLLGEEAAVGGPPDQAAIPTFEELEAAGDITVPGEAGEPSAFGEEDLIEELGDIDLAEAAEPAGGELPVGGEEEEPIGGGISEFPMDAELPGEGAFPEDGALPEDIDGSGRFIEIA